jgi:Tfp pilus assembly protein PilN
MKDTKLRLWGLIRMGRRRAERLDLDFARAQRQSRGQLLFLLAVAAVALAVVLWQSDQAEQSVAGLEAAVQAAGGGAKKVRRVVAAESFTGAELEDRVRKANRVIRQFSAPWEDVFGSIEQVNGEHVALLSLESDPTNAQVRVSAEARNFTKMLDYLERLRLDGRLAPAILQSHQVMVDDPNHPVRFTFTASWTSAKKAPK